MSEGDAKTLRCTGPWPLATCDASHALCPSLAFCSSARSTRPPRNWPRDFILFPLASNRWLPSQCRSLDPPSGPLLVHLAAHSGERQVKECQREGNGRAPTHMQVLCKYCASAAHASAVQVLCKRRTCKCCVSAREVWHTRARRQLAGRAAAALCVWHRTSFYPSRCRQPRRS